MNWQGDRPGMTAAQKHGLEIFVDGCGTSQKSKGRALYHAGNVMLHVPTGNSEIFTAEVQGGALYRVTLVSQSTGFTSICNCPFRVACKHAVAFALDLIAHAPVFKSQLAAHRRGSELSEYVRRRIGKKAKIKPEAERFLAEVDRWWHDRLASVEQNRLQTLCGRMGFWSSAMVKIIPDGVTIESPAEYLVCLDHAAKLCNASLPNPIPEALDATLAQRVRDVIHAEAATREWRCRLDEWAKGEVELALQPLELRIQLSEKGASILMEESPGGPLVPAKAKYLRDLLANRENPLSSLLTPEASVILRLGMNDYSQVDLEQATPFSRILVSVLSRLATRPGMLENLVRTPDGQPLTVHSEPLRWNLQDPGDATGDYELQLRDVHGRRPRKPIAILPGTPMLYVTPFETYPISSWPLGCRLSSWPQKIPALALETSPGVAALTRLGVSLPQRLASRIRKVRPDIDIRLAVHSPVHGTTDYLQLSAQAFSAEMATTHFWNGDSWESLSSRPASATAAQGELVILQTDTLEATAQWLRQRDLRRDHVDEDGRTWHQSRIHGKDWGEHFAAWLAARPDGISLELAPELSSFLGGAVSGRVKIHVTESPQGIDWFDLTVALDVSDTSLTRDEIQLLLKAKGRWIRLAGRGWRKLEFDINDAQLAEIADLGLAVQDFSSEKQQLHALQLAGLAKKASSLLPADQMPAIRRRLEEIQTRVAPPPPDAIQAALRPYQVEGFQFLAYLTKNSFGGVLADDMGLGKTLQTLTWFAWLRSEGLAKHPFLVVCPKSVQDNWRAECTRFLPDLRVETWTKGTTGQPGLDGSADLLVIHYGQLRAHEEKLRAVRWTAVVLDEAQAIKNPSSQNAKAACALTAAHRLALTGTPVENRLLDLWSIFAFAMPGVLGSRAAFTRNFDGQSDALARRRLAARTRPFLLRRTKSEVAKDLPERVEEDLIVELEDDQLALYQAEVKRARAQLLKVETARELDKLRFNILTSLLRLRQICCHPKLVGFEKSTTSAKLDALRDLLEPLLQEGQKVVVFSQFLEMLDLIGTECAERSWKTFRLDGGTDNRGELVDNFQSHEGPAVFLISLKAGGSGLNLTAASYVVLFDPWWNPAVEAQAIDRTHRIGQKNTVFAYRLVAKNSIEEKIRMLQKQKGDLARDILGEENFAQALTLSDFQFLLGGDDIE